MVVLHFYPFRNGCLGLPARSPRGHESTSPKPMEKSRGFSALKLWVVTLKNEGNVGSFTVLDAFLNLLRFFKLCFYSSKGPKMFTSTSFSSGQKKKLHVLVHEY